MTALPLQPPEQPPPLLTVADYAALPEDTDVRYELYEGRLFVSPRPMPTHQYCLRQMLIELTPQTPGQLEVMPEVDVDLGLVPADQPGFVRIPDIAVVTSAGLDRLEREGGLLRASEVVLAVEIISYGSQRTDRTAKHGEYADAGIPHYWIVDIDGRPSLIACHQAGEFGYADAPAVTGTFTTEKPFPVRLDLDRLARDRS